MKWGIILRNTLGSPNAKFRVGPYGRTSASPTAAADQPPPCGVGSLEMIVKGPPTGATNGTTDAQKLVFGNETDFAGVALSSISILKYSIFIGMDGGAGGVVLPGVSLPGLELEVFPNGTSGFSTLVYLPNGTPAATAPSVPASILVGQWQGYDAAAAGSKWFATGAAGTSSGCTLATPCDFATLKSALPAAVISYSLGITKGRDDSFLGAVDCLQVNNTLYDFEPDGVHSSTVTVPPPP